MSRFLLPCLVLSFPLILLQGCGKSYSYKYRLTVSVDDHGTTKTASNVVHVTERVGLTGNIGRPSVCGEALVLPLKNGKTLFGLLNGINRDAVTGRAQWWSVPTSVLLSRLGLEIQFGSKDDTGIMRLPETRTRIDHLKIYEIPEFVTFRNASDPTTIERVDYESPERQLGGGVRFQNVSLEVTDDRVTTNKVSSALPWLSMAKRFLDGSPRGATVLYYETSQFKTCNWLNQWLYQL